MQVRHLSLCLLEKAQESTPQNRLRYGEAKENIISRHGQNPDHAMYASCIHYHPVAVMIW